MRRRPWRGAKRGTCPGARIGQGVGPPRARRARAQAGAARGCARVRSRPRTAAGLDRPYAPRPGGAVGTKGVPTFRPPRPPAGVEQRAAGKGRESGRPCPLPSALSRAWPREPQGRPVRAVQDRDGGFPCPRVSRGLSRLPSGSSKRDESGTRASHLRDGSGTRAGRPGRGSIHQCTSRAGAPPPGGFCARPARAGKRADAICVAPGNAAARASAQGRDRVPRGRGDRAAERLCFLDPGRDRVAHVARG